MFGKAADAAMEAENAENQGENLGVVTINFGHLLVSAKVWEDDRQLRKEGGVGRSEEGKMGEARLDRARRGNGCGGRFVSG
jgi:hypothetical protein